MTLPQGLWIDFQLLYESVIDDNGLTSQQREFLIKSLGKLNDDYIRRFNTGILFYITSG